ncbi:Uncharacterized protein FVE85_2250 [Porphyridium purpureum]|uniref:Protein kinase domain-containing protein n=1 Tax=Porphyridium purpureum TaxID=35688 RepID=A0A5J4YY94_PORPP|nr:Uncharacterized protein FVE85_2250 [Porphyridium purpureum]|eukprot:POR7369..scf209_3
MVPAFVFSATPTGATRDALVQSKRLQVRRQECRACRRSMRAAVSSGTDAAGSEIASPGQAVVMPKPLTSYERIKRSVTFWSRVVPILLKYRQTKRRIESSSTYLSKQEREEIWNQTHEWGSDELINVIQELKGFYVKSGQVISSRVDLFPEPYIRKLSVLQDSIEPIDTAIVKEIVRQELLEGEPLETLFSHFEEKPLGSASIAQVHRAVLVDGRIVAVKVQRPAEEPKLRADIANLKLFAKRFREQLPADYFIIFSELERALYNELDFQSEALNQEKIHATIAHLPNGQLAEPPLVVPRPIPGLVTRKVLVMEFVQGLPLLKAQAAMKERGYAASSPESRLVGLRLLESLTEAYSRQVFGSGILHGDAHPGNILVLPEASGFALIDCGQVKQLSGSLQQLLARTMLCVRDFGDFGKGSSAFPRAKVAELAGLVREFGVQVNGVDEEQQDNVLASCGLVLFGPSNMERLPGGLSPRELDPNSPIKQVSSFPQELVMLGRATILIKGLAARLNIPWFLAEKWAPAAEQALQCGVEGCYRVPVYAKPPPPVGAAQLPLRSSATAGRPKFREVVSLFRSWAKGKSIEMLPASAKSVLAERALAKQLEENK